jgi:putative Mn2+ efflux pump MntP
MKSLNIDIIFPWEVGLVLVIMGLILIFVGVRQGKKEIDDFDKIYFVKPTTKMLSGFVCCLFGAIQMLPILSGFL